MDIKRDEVADAVKEAVQYGAGKVAINNRLGEFGKFGYAGDEDKSGMSFAPNSYTGLPVVFVKQGGNNYAYELG